MTKSIDNFWVSRGVHKAELAAVKGRGLIYTALLAMSGTAGALLVGIASNLAA